jgi:peroxin-19
LKENCDRLSQSDRKRYEQQYEYCRQIVALYDKSEGSASSSSSDANAEQVTKLMQKMQECGQPPAELMHALAPGMELDAEGQPQLPDDCKMQ